MSDWQKIWNARAINLRERPQLTDLLQLDGYDKGAGIISPKIWRAYVARRAGELRIKSGLSVFEIGCGAGAFLWPLHEIGCLVSGLDYSPVLIATAKQAMPEGNWWVAEANHPLGEKTYDIVLAQSVWHYFPDKNYAKHVLQNMLSAARQAVGILDVLDTSLAAAAETSRRATLGEEEYKKRYAGLHHLTFDPHWFQANVPAGWLVTTSPQDIPNYGNNRYRFNVMIRRHEH